MSAARQFNREGIGLGSYVQRKSHDMKGRVINVHVSCPMSAEWVKAQEPPIKPEAMRVGYVWFDVLVHGGGSVTVPAYDLKNHGGFLFENDWAAEYFPVMCEMHDWKQTQTRFECANCGNVGLWDEYEQTVTMVKGSLLPEDRTAPLVTALVDCYYEATTNEKNGETK